MANCVDVRPAALLGPHVEAFWYSEPARENLCEVLPDTSVEVCFALSERKPGIVLFGPATAPTSYALQPDVAYFGVRFRPGIAALLLPEGLVSSAIALMRQTQYNIRIQELADE
jgi:Domain of unknown function (DUF6597)